MSLPRYVSAIVLTVMISSAGITQAQDPAAAAAPSTIWRFLGIPQGVQKIRDVATNRRGDRPGLERKDPIKRIADPANLESDNPAIKAAAEIKKAEDMKAQKIKAIKYLATIGCGCYDKDGKITDAILAATDDCTPDVRLAAMEAIQEAACGSKCKKCGSTSCCSEKVTARLSEIAYERDDTGCPLEPSAEVRQAAKRALCICCPGGTHLGPIEEAAPGDESQMLPVPDKTPTIPGETDSDDTKVKGEGEGDVDEAKEESAYFTPQLETVTISAKRMDTKIGIPARPVLLGAATNHTSSPLLSARKVRRNVPAKVLSINRKTGLLLLSSTGTDGVSPGRSIEVYHLYLTGERKVGELVVKQVTNGRVLAQVKPSTLMTRLHVGDRAVVR